MLLHSYRNVEQLNGVLKAIFLRFNI
jgi:hypothetical protein